MNCKIEQVSSYTILRYLEILGIDDAINNLHIPIKKVKYSSLDKAKTLILSMTKGCRHIADINDKLKSCLYLTKTIGLEEFPDQSQINIYNHRFNEKHIKQLKEFYYDTAKKLVSELETDSLDVDIDALLNHVDGENYEKAKKTYKGKKGYALTVAHTRSLSLDFHFQGGNANNTYVFKQLVDKVSELVPERITISLRTDAFYGSVGNVVYVHNHSRKFKYLMKLNGVNSKKMYNKVKGKVPDATIKKSKETHYLYDLGTQTVKGQNQKGEKSQITTRIIVQVIDNPKKNDLYYTAFATNRTFPVENIIYLYPARNSVEAFFKILEQVFAIGNMRHRNFNAELTFITFLLLVVNVALFISRNLFKDTKWKRFSVGTLLTKFERTYIVIYNNKIEVHKCPEQLVNNFIKIIKKIVLVI